MGFGKRDYLSSFVPLLYCCTYHRVIETDTVYRAHQMSGEGKREGGDVKR